MSRARTTAPPITAIALARDGRRGGRRAPETGTMRPGGQGRRPKVQDAPPPFTTYQPIPTVVDGHVIVGTTDVSATAALLAFDAASGSPTWRVDLPSLCGVLFSPVVAGDRIHTPSFSQVDDGGLLAFARPG